jgi:hypothetical protein
VINVDATSAGYYYANGMHDPNEPSYAVGYLLSPIEDVAHNYFAFPIPSIGDPILSVALEVVQPANGYASPDASEPYEIYDYTSALDVTAGYLPNDAHGQTIFGDVGSGTSYGSTLITSSAVDVLYSIPLNAAGVSDVAATGAGNLFVIGGALTDLTPETGQLEAVFGFTSQWPTEYPAPPRLVITTEDAPGPEVIPEPTTLALLGCALFGLARRRRQ